MRLVEMITTFTYTPSDVDAFYNTMINNVFDLSTKKYRSTATFNQKDEFNAYVDAGDIESVTIEKTESDTKVLLTIKWYSSASWLEYMKGEDQWYAKLTDGTSTSILHTYLQQRINNAMVVDYDHQDTEPALSHYNLFSDWVGEQKQKFLDDGKSAAFAHTAAVLYDNKHANFSTPSGGWAWADFATE